MNPSVYVYDCVILLLRLNFRNLLGVLFFVMNNKCCKKIPGIFRAVYVTVTTEIHVTGPVT